MAEFHIWLKYISKQHMGAKNTFLLRIFDRCAAKTRFFPYVTQSESGVGGQDAVHARPQDLTQMAPLPPSAHLEDFTEGFEILMRAAVSSQLDFICMGDFNFDLCDVHAINLDFFF